MSEERKHSILAPSSKEWVHCGFSAKFLANKEEETNEASEFGTECHALAEAYIKQSLKIDDFDEGPVSIDELKSSFKHYDEEMETLATGYVNFVISQADYEEKRTGKKPIVFVIILDANIGYFECAECHERFIPSVKDYTFGLHTLKKRKLTCPKCGKKTWCSKRINKNIEVNK